MKVRKILFRITALCLFGLFVGSELMAQTPPSNLKGQALRSWLKKNYYEGKHNQLGYRTARLYMYNYIDNKNNKITCVYSGYQVKWNFGGTGTNPKPINCEHTVPQSFFSKAEPMKSDIHHLFPTYQNWNSTRSNHPFKEIDDSKTKKWMYLTNSQSTVPSNNIDLYSEYASSSFEPREDHKGNCARAIFYFYTMYPTQAGNIGRVANINTLYEWHMKDPVDAAERKRNDDVEKYQGDRNPYIDKPNLVALAWNFSVPDPNPDPNPDPDPNPGTISSLFISEYIEGSSYNKGLEIANFTGKTVDLSAYSIKKQTNGSGSWGSELKLEGMVKNKEVYVMVNERASEELLGKANLKTGSQALWFNGNDPVGLFKDGKLLDVVGGYNNSTYFAKDVTLVRKPSVDSPSADYDVLEWLVSTKDDFSNLGKHVSEWKNESTPISMVEKSNKEGLSVKVYPIPAQETINVELKRREKLGKTVVTFTDQKGRLVHKEQKVIYSNEYTLNIDVSSFAKGVYLVQISGEKFSDSQKIIIR